MEGEPNIAAKAKTNLYIFNNEIVEAAYKSHHILPIVLEGVSKVNNDNKWRKYCERISQLDKQRVKALYMI